MGTFLENLQLFWGILRIVLFNIFCRCCRTKKIAKVNFPVICVGLGGSGKTTMLKSMCHEDPSNIQPTSGFAIKVVELNKCLLTIKEIGGGEKILPYWHHYYEGAGAIIFMVDSSARIEDLEDVEVIFRKVISEPVLHNLPLLVFSSFSDKVNLASDKQIVDALCIELNCHNREYIVQNCSKFDRSTYEEGLNKLSSILLSRRPPSNDT